MNMVKKLVGGVVFAAVALGAIGAYAESGCWTRVRFQKTNGGKAL